MFWLIKNFFLGIFIGAGAILPGISSGVLCVIFGIYEKLLDSILNFFKNIKKNFTFLLPILLGIILGIILLGKALNYLFYKFPIQTKSIFIGLIIGTIPSLLNELKKHSYINEKNEKNQKNSKSLNNKIISKNSSNVSEKIIPITFFIISFVIGIFMVLLENHISLNTEPAKISSSYLFFSGLLMSIGIVVPGVSSTVILMLLGTYYTYISAIANLSINILIPLGFGVVIGSIIFMKIINKLFKNFYIQTFSCIIGFSIGSILILFPQIHNYIEIIICLLGIIIGLNISKIFKNNWTKDDATNNEKIGER